MSWWRVVWCARIHLFLVAIIFEMIWTQIHARRITAGQISVTDVARPRFRVPPGLLFALAVPRYTYIDRLVAVHLVYERVLRLLPDISNFDNSSAGVIIAPQNINDDRKTIRRHVLMADAINRIVQMYNILYLTAIYFANCRWETSWRKWHSLSIGILEVVSK